jgi:serine/threonine protein kinase
MEWLAELDEHPHIPKLLDTFEQNGQGFIVQEWIDGLTLEEIAGMTPLNEVEVRQVLHELLLVLQYLHSHQIVHRDIKPANIIRRHRDQRLVLVDFGSAMCLSSINMFNDGIVIGSAEYAAPEQLRGQANCTSDLYSLGVTGLHLLTQMSPFDLYDIGDNMWKWQEYLTQPTSPALDAIFCNLLQPISRRRYQSATAVLADLNTSWGQGGTASQQRLPGADCNVPATLMSSTLKKTSSPLVLVYEPEIEQSDLSTQTQTSELAAQFTYTVALFLSSRLRATTPSLNQNNAPSLAVKILVTGVGTAIACVAATCLVVCLGIIFTVLSLPPQLNPTPLRIVPVAPSQLDQR